MQDILIVCALGQEMKIVKKTLKGSVRKGFRLHFFCSGLGLEKSSITLTQFLVQSTIDFVLVISIGIAGFATNNKDADLLSYQGKLVQCLHIIQGDSHKELCVPPEYIFSDVSIVPLLSWYRPLAHRSKLLPYFSTYDFFAVDMEGYAIESVCSHYNISRIFLKVLYDEIKDDGKKISHDNALDVFEQSLVSLPSLLNYLFFV